MGERQQWKTTLAKDLARFYDAPVSLGMPVNARSRTMCGMMNSRQKITITYSWDSMIKPLSSSIVGANRGP